MTVLDDHPLRTERFRRSATAIRAGGTLVGTNQPPVSVAPEFFADTILVNGAPYPTISLPPGRFRFRVLNASQARFYNLQTVRGKQLPMGSRWRHTADMIPTEIPPGARRILPARHSSRSATRVASCQPRWCSTRRHRQRQQQPALGLRFDPMSDVGNANRYNLLLAPG